MEYFNTFGGNNVSCVIGKEVLDVIKEENLQQNAKHLGQLLRQELQSLQNQFDCIGDIRGEGLFYGIEFILDKKTQQPGTSLAKGIVQKLREDFRILVSTDGPYDNVLKLKPPLCWTAQNVYYFISSLQNVLHHYHHKSHSSL